MSTATHATASPTSRPDTPQLLLPAVPTLPEPDGEQGGITNLLPMTGAFTSVAMVVGAGPGGSGLRGVLMAASVILSSLLLVLAQVARQRLRRRRAIEHARSVHLHELRTLSDHLHADQESRLRTALAAWPEPDAPDAAASPVGSASLIRLGSGTSRIHLTCAVAEPGPGVPDPVCVDAVNRFAAAHSSAHGVPVPLDLSAVGHLLLRGSPHRVEEMMRAVLLQASRRPPSELTVAVLCAADEIPRWDWVKWLPHAGGDRLDAAGPVRLVDHRPERLLARLPRRGHTLLVVTPGRSADASILSPSAVPTAVTVLTDVEPAALGRPDVPVLRVDLADRPDAPSVVFDATAARLDGFSEVIVDRCSLVTAGAVARRRAAPLPTDRSPSRERPDLTALLCPPGWPTVQRADTLLRVPIGAAPDGSLVHLDLKESARGGHGPHGLLVGATGSGKSELLRTLIVGLVGSHLPDDLALVLVDFKGGATFADVEDLPHVAACVTNLSDDTALVDRMQDALGGELERRQELLHATGHANVHEYRAARERDGSLAPLPHLFVCVDEFSELLSARPEFVDLFTAIGRLGRSLGIHLLLASQRLDEGRLHALEAHLSYRIALRTFSGSESRAAIGVPDAHTLPRHPGAGLFRTGAEDPSRFDAFHVGAPATTTVVAERSVPVLFTVLPARPAGAGPAAAAPTHPGEAHTVADVVLERARSATAGVPPTRRVWLPPLSGSFGLGVLLGDLRTDETLGLHAPALRAHHGMVLPFALVDRPRLQRLDTFALDLGGARGHVAVVGAPRSGRSTTLQTLTCAVALGRTPAEAQIHLLDLAGSDLGALARLPHTRSYATRHQPGLVLRIVEGIVSIVTSREQQPVDGSPEVYLVVDGWGTLRQDFEDVEAALVTLAPRALAVGVHLIAAAVRWGDFRPSLLDVISSRIELRLGDPFDSVVDRRAAAHVPFDRPGRGLAPGGATMLVARPSFGADDTADALVERVAGNWPGPVAPRLRDLPDQVRAADLGPAPHGRLTLGADEGGRTVTVSTREHLVVHGPEGSGRTSVLRRHVQQWLAAVPGGQVLLLDPRGSLTGVADDAHLLGHAATSDQAGALLREVADHLTRRLLTMSDTVVPPSAVPVTVVVDDLDLLRSTGVDLSALTPLLPRAESIGLSVVISCRGAGSMRSVDRLAELVADVGASTLDLTGEPAGRGRLTVRGGRSATSVQCVAP